MHPHFLASVLFTENALLICDVIFNMHGIHVWATINPRSTRVKKALAKIFSWMYRQGLPTTTLLALNICQSAYNGSRFYLIHYESYQRAIEWLCGSSTKKCQHIAKRVCRTIWILPFWTVLLPAVVPSFAVPDLPICTALTFLLWIDKKSSLPESHRVTRRQVSLDLAPQLETFVKDQASSKVSAICSIPNGKSVLHLNVAHLSIC